MDKHTNLLEVQRSNGEFTGFRCLKRIDEHNTTPQRLKWLWEKMQECEYAFDDFTLGKVDYFLEQFANEGVEFYTMGESGLVVLSNIIEKGGSNIHYMMWDHSYQLTAKRGPALDAFDYLFYKRKVHHVVGFIPSFNHHGIRFALSVGMKFEGEIREDSLHKGRYYATHIYGILDWEYATRRARLL